VSDISVVAERDEAASMVASGEHARARLAAESDYRQQRSDTIMPLVHEAREAGDPVTLSEALSLAHHCLLGPEHTDLRLRLAEELLRVGSRTGRPSDVVMGLLWRTADLFLLGDPHAERSLAELSNSAAVTRNAAAAFIRSGVQVMLDDADWLADELRGSTGLGGRARQFADNPERARIAVGKAIRRALDRVSAADPVLGEHLRRTVRTGMRCRYQP
jgi:hypothetical protein